MREEAAITVQDNLRVQVQVQDGLILLAVSGELDLASAPMLAEQLQRADEVDADVVLVDLRELDFMDSTGLHLLLKAHKRAQELGRRFVLVKGNKQIERLLSLTGVDEKLVIVDSPEELSSD
ncbi:MAG: STAS domain-containing protein [Solirubrobacterales bacterium]|nr:STAS domain-containing protein [Solirubrobacterales bacterium]